MNRPNLERLPKDALVAMYRALIGSPGDYARRPRDYYRTALDARGSAELSASLETLNRKPRKESRRSIDKRNALANAKECYALVRAFAGWGTDLLTQPDAHAKLLERAQKVIGK